VNFTFNTCFARSIDEGKDEERVIVAYVQSYQKRIAVKIDAVTPRPVAMPGAQL
jgi:hypothetical protein